MDSTGRPQRADARRNYARLVATASEVFRERGPDATLDEIAKRAAVGPGTLYRHFPNRDAVLAAIYRADIEAMASFAEESVRTLPPREALASFMRQLIEFGQRNRGVIEAIKAMLRTDSDTMDYCRSTLRGAATAVVGRAQEAGVVRTDIEPADVLKLTHGVSLAAESSPDGAERLLTVLLDGLRPPS